MKTRPNDPMNSCEVSYTGEELIGMQTGNSTGIDIGLTKREYFAAMAMQGIATSFGRITHSFEDVAIDSVKMADALITELNK